MSEAKLVAEFKEAVEFLHKTAHMSEVESHLTSAGIPDVDLCIDGEEFHLEFKHSATNAPPKIRPSQVKWFKKRVAAGGNPWIVAHLEGLGVLLIPGCFVGDLIKSSRRQEWMEFAQIIIPPDLDHLTYSDWHVLIEGFRTSVCGFVQLAVQSDSEPVQEDH